MVVWSFSLSMNFQMDLGLDLDLDNVFDHLEGMKKRSKEIRALGSL